MILYAISQLMNKKFPMNKAIGPDCISHKMLKSTIFTIVKSLTMLFNRSLLERVFPSFRKLANIIHTKLRQNCILNYDLCKRNILNTGSPQCSFGKQEDAYHFFFVCKNYSIARNTLFD